MPGLQLFYEFKQIKNEKYRDKKFCLKLLLQTNDIPAVIERIT